MKLEELQDKILELTELNNTLKNELDSIKKLTEEEKSNFAKEKEEKEKRILELQEHNQKLFLKVTHKQEEKKPEEFKSKLLGEYAKDLDEEHLKLLKEIEEGL